MPLRTGDFTSHGSGTLLQFAKLAHYLNEPQITHSGVAIESGLETEASHNSRASGAVEISTINKHLPRLRLRWRIVCNMHLYIYGVKNENKSQASGRGKVIGCDYSARLGQLPLVFSFFVFCFLPTVSIISTD